MKVRYNELTVKQNSRSRLVTTLKHNLDQTIE